MLERLRSLLPARLSKPAALLGGGTPYAGGDRGSNEAMVNWNPSLRGADSEGLPDRDAIVARARDLARNNGWVAGAVTSEVDAVVGADFRPLAKPNWRALGVDEAWALEWKEALEGLWEADADDARFYQDASRQMPIGRLFALAYRNYLLEGDALGQLTWHGDRPVRTGLRIIDPDLLSNPDGLQDAERLRGGVEIDANGAAIAYHFQEAHQGDLWSGVAAHRWVRLAREEAWGRPVVLHFFDKHRDGQTRGVSRLAPIIEKLRMEDHYGRVELQAAVINAVLAAFVKSPMDTEAIGDLLSEEPAAWDRYNEDRAEFYRARGDVRMAGAKIPHLYPGEEIGTVPSARPAAQFADFESAVLRHVAAGLGTSYEVLSSDWSKTNYSSARASMVEIWRGWTSRRGAFAGGFCQPYLMGWLEEKVDAGLLPMPSRAPDFHEHWAAYARVKWIGPGKGFVDPVKEVQASAMRVALGLSTLEDETAELTGADWSDNIVQIRREIAALPEGSLHPMQESFAKLLGAQGAGPNDEREESRP